MISRICLSMPVTIVGFTIQNVLLDATIKTAINGIVTLNQWE